METVFCFGGKANSMVFFCANVFGSLNLCVSLNCSMEGYFFDLFVMGCDRQSLVLPPSAFLDQRRHEQS
jgi:hypothetical protein